MSADVQPIKPGRLLSLDAFRGITIAAMFLVNNAGDWGHVFLPLRHASWHGCTATDLIFPFFLFIMGVAMTFSFARRIHEENGRRELMPQILRRTCILFGLGLILNLIARSAFPWVEHFRVLGVLQRIALCYLFASLITLWFTPRGIFRWTLGLLVGYYVLLKFVPVPGFGAGILEKQGNWVGWFDTQVLGKHAYAALKDSAGELTGYYHEPEGILSTIPAIATTLTGILCGYWLRKKETTTHEKVAGMASVGLLVYAVGELWKYNFPYNKEIWTSSYVLHTTALGLWTLAACYWFVDVKRYTAWTKPFVVYGTNAITAYFGVGVMAATTIWIKIPTSEMITDPKTGELVAKTIFLKTWIYENLYASWIPKVADIVFPDGWGLYISSASYGMTYVVLWCGLMWILYRKNIFIKV